MQISYVLYMVLVFAFLCENVRFEFLFSLQMSDYFGFDMVYQSKYFHVMFYMCDHGDSCKCQHRNAWHVCFALLVSYFVQVRVNIVAFLNLFYYVGVDPITIVLFEDYIYIYAHTLLFVVVLFSLGCLHVINMSFSFFVQVLWSYKVALFNFICMLCHFFWCQCWHQCIIVALCHVIFILCQCLPYENGLFFTYARFLFLFFNVLVPTFLPCGGKC